jgi:hypothetical protein
MNPVLQQAALSILRWGLTLFAGWLTQHGWSDANAPEYITAGAVALLALGWSIWQKYHAQVVTMTALAMPKGSTPEDLHESVTLGNVADANTPKDQTPVIAKGTA